MIQIGIWHSENRVVCCWGSSNFGRDVIRKSNIVSSLLCLICVPALLVPPPTLAADDPYALYGQRKYAAAADAFEHVIKTSPNARSCYYAALSNNACGRSLRAKQLFKYILTSYPSSTEAKYAAQVLAKEKPAEAPAATLVQQDSGSDLPASVKNAMSPEMQRLLSSPMGKKAVEQVMKQQSSQIATIKTAEQKGLMDQSKVNAAVQQAGASDARSHGDKDHPFTPADIARDGAAGIDQSRYPNCWFESSMAALAELPRGQKLLSNMIHKKNADDYIVRFPGDGVEYLVTPQHLLTSGINDKALWASILECAEIQKFPNNQGSTGSSGEQSRLEVGLGCITGCKAETVYPRSASVQELSAFISGALKTQNPIVACTYDAAHFEGPIVVFPLHAYTVVGFDATKNMVTLRNPHGLRSANFELPGDLHHEEFEQLSGGLCKISIPRLQKCFYSMARSFI